jgi:hypothetical protein
VNTHDPPRPTAHEEQRIMPLSAHEKQVLATLEEELRTDDPSLAAVLSRTLPPSIAAHPFLPSINQLGQLATALIILSAVGTFFGNQLGVLGIAALTGATVIPWLLSTARSAARRSSTTEGSGQQSVLAPGKRGSSASPAVSFSYQRGALFLALGLATLMLVSPTWGAVLVLVLAILAAPVLLPRLIEWLERRDTSRRTPTE